MADKRKTLLLRLDPKLHAKLREWAQDEFRSLNAHLEYLLRQALRQAGRLKEKGGAGG